MNNKKILITLIISIFFCINFTNVYAVVLQQIEEIGYCYDFAGNRIGRKIIPLNSPPPSAPPAPPNSAPPAPPEDNDDDDGLIIAENNNETETAFEEPTPETTGSTTLGNKDIFAETGKYEINNEVDAVTQDFENNTGKAMVDFMKNRKVIIYPNPTKGQLKIELKSEEDIEQIPVLIFDTNGILVFSHKMIENPLLIDLSTQTNGTYILRIGEGEGASVWKIVKLSEL